MDPTETLRIIATTTGADRFEACQNLRRWISTGGFGPHWALYPEATKFYVRTFGWRPSMPEEFRP